LKKAIVGIPKTIDNDHHVSRQVVRLRDGLCRGVQSVKCAYVEATGAVNGLGLIS